MYCLTSKYFGIFQISFCSFLTQSCCVQRTNLVWFHPFTFFKPVLWPSIWPILIMLHMHLTWMHYSADTGCSVLRMSVQSGRLMVLVWESAWLLWERLDGCNHKTLISYSYGGGEVYDHGACRPGIWWGPMLWFTDSCQLALRLLIMGLWYHPIPVW